ncbi:hypothetical protein AAZX31_09G055700 [Glycine max]
MQGEVQNKDVPQYRRIATLLIKIIGKPKWTLIGRLRPLRPLKQIGVPLVHNFVVITIVQFRSLRMLRMIGGTNLG